jgi:replicative DNA helicase
VRSSGTQIAKLAGDDTLGEAQRLLGACAPRMASNIKHAREHLRQSVRLMQDRCDATEILTGVPTSLDWLDEITSGWQRGDLILIGARPSVGKTALALQTAAHAAKSGHATLFLSLEMAGAQLTDRLLSHLSGVNGQFIRQPKTMPEECWGRILSAGEEIEKMPLLIEDTSALTLEGVCARVRQANAMQRLGLVVLDYLTCMTPPKAEKLTDGIQMITRGLKALAKDLRVPIVLLSQLNRTGGEHRPNLSSLRESGAIEQDADVVLFLHRPNESQRHLIECLVAKQRNGPVGETYLHFNGETQRFIPTEEKPQSAQVVNIAKPVRGMTRHLEKSAGE